MAKEKGVHPPFGKEGDDKLFQDLTAAHFIVTADWHLGLTRYSRDDKHGIPDRHNELIKSIEYIFKYAHDVKALFMVICGDIFDTNHPSQIFYADLMPLFQEAGMPIYVFPGNHDAINTIKQANALRTIFKAKMKNIHVINDVSAISLNNDYNLIFIPHVNRCEYSSFNDDAEIALINKKIEALFAGTGDKPDDIFDNKISSKCKNIIFGHAMVPGSVQGTERLVMRGGEQKFSLHVADTVSYFFGHMHTPQQMNWGGAPLYYPGSIQAIDMGERDDAKSFIDAALKGNIIDVSRVAVPTRKLIQIDIASIEEYNKLLTDPKKPNFTDAIVKTVCEIPAEQKSLIDESKIYDHTAEAYWSDIEYKLQRETATRNENVTAEADPDTAFAEWYKSKQYPEEGFKEVAKLNSEIMAKVTEVNYE